MTEIIQVFSTAFVAFIATNIDDLLILTLLFSQINSFLRHWHIVIGQYLGLSFLILASLSGLFLGTFFLPISLIKWLGIVPIILGINLLLSEPEEKDSREDISAKISAEYSSRWSRWLAPQTCGIAAITIANGSDNIGIYVPLFAASDSRSLIVTLVTFLVLVGVWCYLAYKLVSWHFLARIIPSYSQNLIPCIFIALGVFIVKESILLTLVAFVGSLLTLFLWTKNRVVSSN
jgi:cadmium resistance transport/sequestration family protein